MIAYLTMENENNHTQTLGKIWAACGDDCKVVSKGFNSFESSLNKLSAAFRAVLQA